MKLNSLLVTVAVGMLAVVPVRANWQGINPATYASRFRPATPAASQAKPEMQVAVMAQSAATKAGTKVPGATQEHPWGQPHPYATHSH
jgi:hypothetical protein